MTAIEGNDIVGSGASLAALTFEIPGGDGGSTVDLSARVGGRWVYASAPGGGFAYVFTFDEAIGYDALPMDGKVTMVASGFALGIGARMLLMMLQEFLPMFRQLNVI